MRKCLALVAALLCGCASFQKPDDWTTADTGRQIAYFSTLAADAATTTRIADHPGLEEGSPIARSLLGPQPDSTETYAAAVLLGLAHYWIGRRMKPNVRRVWQYVGITVHTQAVSQNCDNGLC